ncbi:MAG TPA: SatD family protein [Clostridia bacterium]|nr:SatD family protein [Clostridia bacterium]
MEYCAIIGDIVNSRKLNNRPEVQSKLVHVIENSVNENYRRYIASNFTVTLGDEFQGLLYKEFTYLSYEIIRFIKKQLAPINLVFGVGVGAMIIEPKHEISIGSDGPAYYNARNAVSEAKNKKPSIYYYTGSEEDELVNSMIHLIEGIEKKMTHKQQEVIKLYKSSGSQSKTAEKLDIMQSTVSRMLNNSGYYRITDAEAAISSYFKKKYK